MGHCSLAEKNARGRKNDFFRNFLFSCTSTHWDKTFLPLPNFHIFSRLEKSWGDKQNVNFQLKMTSQAKKMTFFEIFFSVAHLLIKTKLFCFYQNFISLEKSWGGKIALQQTNKQTNKQTNTTNDHNSPPGFFQNPRANNILINLKNLLQNNP